jgi:SAM-dependent methyltransferase
MNRETMKTLKPREDAFGQILWDLHNGIENCEIIERDDKYMDAYPAKGYFSTYENWSPTEQKALTFVRGRVLDVGCGAGRHSIYLQDNGFNVLGTDVSPLALRVCKLRGLKKTKLAPIEKLNFKPNSFDTIIMMGNNFGLLANHKQAKRLLKRFSKITSKNATIIADTRDPYKTANSAHLTYHRQNRKKGRMGGQIHIRVRYKNYIGKWFDYLFVSKEEMEEILIGTGWKVKQFIDSQKEEQYAVIMMKNLE